jgi:internalin A
LISKNNKHYIEYKTLKNIEANEPKIETFVFKNGVKEHYKDLPVAVYQNFVHKKLKDMKKVFISYSRADVDYKNELKKYLNFLGTFKIADAWSCDEITIGLWDDQIQKELHDADLIIFMLSIDFFGSNYILQNEVYTGINSIRNNPDKQILCVKVGDFPSLDKIRSVTANNVNTTLHDIILSLGDYQYLPYGNIKNIVTGENHEKIKSLKEHSNSKTIDIALTSIANKVIEFCNK